MRRFLSILPFIVLGVSVPASAQTGGIAVVDIPAASERYHKRADLEAQFDAVRQKLRKERDALQDRLDKAKRSLQEELKPGSDAYSERQKQVVMLEAELQWFVDDKGKSVERELAQSLQEIFKDIQNVVHEIAQEKGYDLVIASDELPPDMPDSPAQVRQFILLQKVLYWSPRVDITDEVVARLNARYGASQSQGSSGNAPPAPESD